MGAMEDATFFDCDNAIEDPTLWIEGSARCDGFAAFSPTMRLLSCLAMPSASSISKWSTIWSSMQWIQWRSGPFKVFEALMKPAPVSWMHWLLWRQMLFLIFAPIQHVNVSWQGCSFGPWHVTEFFRKRSKKVLQKNVFIDDDLLVIWNGWPPDLAATRWYQKDDHQPQQQQDDIK